MLNPSLVSTTSHACSYACADGTSSKSHRSPGSTRANTADAEIGTSGTAATSAQPAPVAGGCSTRSLAVCIGSSCNSIADGGSAGGEPSSARSSENDRLRSCPWLSRKRRVTVVGESPRFATKNVADESTSPGARAGITSGIARGARGDSATELRALPLSNSMNLQVPGSPTGFETDCSAARAERGAITRADSARIGGSSTERLPGP